MKRRLDQDCCYRYTRNLHRDIEMKDITVMNIICFRYQKNRSTLRTS